MKYSLSLTSTLCLMAACGVAQAGEYGTVVSSTAVVAQVAVPQQQCVDQQQLVQPRNTGGGALVGALIGGVVGNSFGSGMGRAAATGLGVVAGAAVGDRTESANAVASSVPVRSCQTLTSYESRVVAYDVAYDYHGQRHVARMSQALNPGDSIALNVSVAPAGAVTSTVPAPLGAMAPTTVVTAAPVVYTRPPVYGYYDYGAPAVVFEGGSRHYGRWR